MRTALLDGACRRCGRLLRGNRGRKPLDAAVESVATGEGELRTTAAVVRNPRRCAGRQAPDRDRALAGVAGLVQYRARTGVLRYHLDLLRGPGASRVGTVRLQPGWQAAQPAGGHRSGDDGRLANRSPRVRWQS